MDEPITVRQAYLAMYSFLERFYREYEFDQLGGLLGGMSLLGDGVPADPAYWSDWLAAVDRARTDQVDAQLRIRNPGEPSRGTGG